jgi:hypothetical protein
VPVCMVADAAEQAVHGMEAALANSVAGG